MINVFAEDQFVGRIDQDGVLFTDDEDLRDRWAKLSSELLSLPRGSEHNGVFYEEPDARVQLTRGSVGAYAVELRWRYGYLVEEV